MTFNTSMSFTSRIRSSAALTAVGAILLSSCGSRETATSTESVVAPRAPQTVDSTAETVKTSTTTRAVQSTEITKEATSETAVATTLPTLDVAAFVAPFSFNNWGLPDTVLSDYPDSMRRVLEETDSVVVATLEAAELASKPAGLFVMPISESGNATPEHELRAARLLFEVQEVVGGLHLPVTTRADGLVEVYVGFTAGADYEPLFTSLARDAIASNATFVLFLDNLVVFETGAAEPTRTAAYTVDPSLGRVLVQRPDGDVAQVTGAYLPFGVDDLGVSLTDQNAIVEILQSGAVPIDQPLDSGGEPIGSPALDELVADLRAPVGALPSHPSRFFNPARLELPYPSDARFLAPPD
jgi:hypothetical protein